GSTGAAPSSRSLKSNATSNSGSCAAGRDVPAVRPSVSAMQHRMDARECMAPFYEKGGKPGQHWPGASVRLPRRPCARLGAIEELVTRPVLLVLGRRRLADTQDLARARVPRGPGRHAFAIGIAGPCEVGPPGDHVSG